MCEDLLHQLQKTHPSASQQDVDDYGLNNIEILLQGILFLFIRKYLRI